MWLPHADQLAPIRASLRPASLIALWAYLVLLIGAELIVTFGSVPLGLGLHLLLICALVLHSGLGVEPQMSSLSTGLMLAPMTRVLSLTLPLSYLPQITWYPIIGGLLSVGVWLVLRQLQMPRQAIGLTAAGLPAQLLIGMCGPLLGIVEYRVLRPESLVDLSSWPQVALAALILIVSTGFMEELFFRGLLQTLALRAMGQMGLIYISLVFVALHIGYRSLIDLLVVAAISYIFAQIVLRSGALLGVAIAHGLTNVTIYIVMPALAAAPSFTQAVVRGLALAGALPTIAMLLRSVWPRRAPIAA